MSSRHPTGHEKPSKPSDDFPLFPHATRRWAKKIKGRLVYFGPWDDPGGALGRYRAFLAGKPLPSAERPARVEKPAKPNPEFPLFPHATKRWAKKIRGKLHYFGPWGDPDGALDSYLRQKDALHAGRKPRAEADDAVTAKRVANAFLNHKDSLVTAGELKPRTYETYKAIVFLMVAHFGKHRLVDDLGPDDFAELRKKLAKRWGTVRLCNAIQTVRSVFRHAYESGLIPHPMRFGPGFARPSKKVLRLERAAKGSMMFEREEIQSMLKAAGPTLKAMILLGVNCGFGNADCGSLPESAVNLSSGWVDFPRPKTGIPRRCKLWPETVAAIKASMKRRPEPKDDSGAGLIFRTKYGKSWAKDIPGNPVSAEMRKLLNGLGINGHRNFYALRHTFRTIADEAKDQVAVDHIMGHARDDMASVYRERIGDDRLEAVAAHVRAWLFAKKGGRS